MSSISAMPINLNITQRCSTRHRHVRTIQKQHILYTQAAKIDLKYLEITSDNPWLIVPDFTKSSCHLQLDHQTSIGSNWVTEICFNISYVDVKTNDC